MAGSLILSETEVFPVTLLKHKLAEDQKILEEYEHHINSGYVSHVLPFATFKRFYHEFQGLLELDRAWTEDEDSRVSELSKKLGY